MPQSLSKVVKGLAAYKYQIGPPLQTADARSVKSRIAAAS